MRDREPTVIRAFDELREFFTLTDGRSAAHALGEDEPRVRRALALLDQRVRAAQTLHDAGHLAESARALADALGALDALAARHAPVASLLGPLPSRERLPTDALDADLTDADRSALQSALEESLGALARVRALTLSEPQRNATRMRRSALAFGAIALVTGAYFSQSRVVKLTPRASSYFSTAYLPTNATDGYSASNWLLPDGIPGWLEVTFDRRRVREIELLNVQGMSHYGAESVTVELYAGPRKVRAFDLSLRGSLGSAKPVIAPLGAGEPLDRIRIHVRTFHDIGGGLAEVRVR
jgi:hypothetical protein